MIKLIKKDKKKMRLGFVLMMGMITIFGVGCFKQNQEEQHTEKVVLNKLGISASGETVSNVQIPKGEEDVFETNSSIYKVNSREYGSEDVKKIVKNLGTSIKKVDETDNLSVQYDLTDGAYLSYFKESGGMVYVSNNDIVEGVKGTNFDEAKCKRVAEDFIKSSNIIDYSELEFKNANVAESVETSEGVQALSYELCYMKKSPQNIEFYGVGPGIKIKIAADYSVDSFTSIDKEIVKDIGKYETIDKKTAVEKICKGKEVQIDGSSEGEKLDVSIDEVNLCLYSDPISLEQNYYAPYYVLEGVDENKNDITIVVPAVENENITYK